MFEEDIRNLQDQEQALLVELNKSKQRLVQLKDIERMIQCGLEDYAECISMYCKRVNEAMNRAIQAESGGIETEILFPERRGIEGTDIQMAGEHIAAEIVETQTLISEYEEKRVWIYDQIADIKQHEMELKAE